MDFIRIDQASTAICHVSRPAFDLGHPDGIEMRIGVSAVEAGDKIMGQGGPLFGGQIQRIGSQFSRGHGTYSATRGKPMLGARDM